MIRVDLAEYDPIDVNKSRKLYEEDIDKIVELRKQGCSYKVIASLLNSSITGVHNAYIDRHYKDLLTDKGDNPFSEIQRDRKEDISVK